ncbi:MAG: HAMP domain-containing histidine kinase [Lachnospiraceae bacterium]|nr:HAMP domain-containing histidine kinase [Lachnospiraceae bacterium]
MREFRGWRALLTGFVTAAIVTAIFILTYVGYCYYLEQDIKTTMTTEIRAVDNGNGSGQITDQTAEKQQEGEITLLKTTPDNGELKDIYPFQFVLYRELCDIRQTKAGRREFLRYQDLYFPDKTALEFPADLPEGVDTGEIQSTYESAVNRVRDLVGQYLTYQEKERFSFFNENYDYWMKGGDIYLTNSQCRNPDLVDLRDYAFFFRIDFDEYGVPAISDQMEAADAALLRRQLNTILHENAADLMGAGEYAEDVQECMQIYPFFQNALERACLVKMPSNCSVAFGMTMDKWRSGIQMEPEENGFSYYKRKFSAMRVRLVCMFLTMMSFLSGYYYLNSRYEERRVKRVLVKVPFEFALVGFAVLMEGWYMMRSWMAAIYYGSNQDYVSAVVFVYLLFFLAWYVGGCIGEVRVGGIWKYLERRSLLVLFGKTIREWTISIYHDLQNVDLGKSVKKKVLLLLLVNEVIVSLFCCAWFAGIIAVIFYTIFLYFWGMKFISRLQRDYQRILRMSEELSNGNLKYEPEESLGVFEPLKGNLVNIRDGFDKAVQEEVKSHKMKTELITNVSHDLKTPLTAIITYIDLLKEKNLTEEQRSQYLGTLEGKSLRLKTLIEDLFEVSKANSGNIQLNLQNCDLASLIKQVAFEMEDKLSEKHLSLRMTLPEEKVILNLDSEKTFRIYENLFGNVAKYAMDGTRVYVSLTETDREVHVSVKNITEVELYLPAEELTERFVRGDASRGTVEGSGLGLAIVRSFTEIQGGKLEIEIDGDLFKVTTIWKKDSRV